MMKKYREIFWFWLMWRLPKRLVYYAVLRAWIFASTGQWNNEEVPAITAHDILQRWDEFAGRVDDSELK